MPNNAILNGTFQAEDAPECLRRADRESIIFRSIPCPGQGRSSGSRVV